jgi:hypothetical protein
MTANQSAEPEVDRIVRRNLDQLNLSIRRGRNEVAAGEVCHRTIDQIIADGRKRRTPF